MRPSTPAAPALSSPAPARRGMVLAAGLGTRLRPLTERLPKPLVPLLGRPIVTYALLSLRSAGITEVVVNLHHRGERLRSALGDGSELGLRLRYSQEERILGTGGGIRAVLPWLAEHGTFVVINGDTLAVADLPAALRRHRERGAAATLLLHRHPAAARYGAVGLDEGGRITGIARLLGPAPESDLLFAGVHLVEPGVLDHLPDGEPSCVLRDGYLPARERGALLCGDAAVTHWAYLGTPARYLAAHQALLARPQQVCPPPPPVPSSPGLTVVPPVWVAQGLRCEGPATVGPDAVLGPNVTLAAGSSVERAVVWGGARVSGRRRDGILSDDGVWVPADGL